MLDGHTKFHPVEQLEEVPLYFSEEKQMVDSILDQVTGVLKVWHRGYCTALQHYNVLYCTLCNLYNHLESKGIWLHKFTQGALNCTQSCGSSLSIKNQFVQSSLHFALWCTDLPRWRWRRKARSGPGEDVGFGGGWPKTGTEDL